MDVFCAEAHRLGLRAPRAAIARLLDGQVRAHAARFGVTEAAARATVTAEDVRALAREVAEPFAKEQPGRDVLDLPVTHTVPLALAARTVAALAIVTDLAAAAAVGDGDGPALLEAVHEPTALIVAWALLIERAATTNDLRVALPEAAIHRAVRELDRGRTHLAAGTGPLDDGDPDRLAHTLALDIAALRAEL